MTSATYHFKGGLTQQECAALVQYALQQPVQNGVVGYGGQQQEHDMRKSNVRWLHSHDRNLDWLKAKTDYWCLKANAENFGLDTKGFLSWQFTEYHGSDEGCYDWHQDNYPFGTQPWDRRISMVVQLSRPKDYEGGVLELEGVTLPANQFNDQGDVILFRSDQRHRVTKVSVGIRFSLVSWFIGPRA